MFTIQLKRFSAEMIYSESKRKNFPINKSLL